MTVMYIKIGLMLALSIGCTVSTNKYKYLDDNLSFQLTYSKDAAVFVLDTKTTKEKVIFRISHDSVFVVKNKVDYLFFVNRENYFDTDSLKEVKRKNGNVFYPFANIVSQYNRSSKQVSLSMENENMTSETPFITGFEFKNNSVKLSYYNGIHTVDYIMTEEK